MLRIQIVHIRLFRIRIRPLVFKEIISKIQKIQENHYHLVKTFSFRIPIHMELNADMDSDSHKESDDMEPDPHRAECRHGSRSAEGTMLT